MALKTDYLDDILNAEVNTRRKYNMIQNGDGTVSFEDVTVYSQEGSTFGAADINEIVEILKKAEQSGEKIESIEDSLNFASSRAIISDANGKLTESNITATKLGYLGDVTSEIQAQINSRCRSTSGTFATLKEFVESLSADTKGLCFIGRFKDNGGWGPTKITGTWYRGLACLQNSQASGNGVSGFVFCQHANAGKVYVGFIDGRNGSYTASWLKLAGLIADSSFDNTVDQMLYLAASDEMDYRAFLGVMESMWTLCPSTNGYLNLGAPNHKWGQIYANSSTISTSDRNVKKDIKELTEQHLAFFRKLQPVSFAFVNGTSGRTHVGFISQDVEKAMEACGLSDLDFAGFCKDQKTVAVEREVDGNVVTVSEPVEGEYVYSLRYEEFIGIIAYAVQRLYDEIDKIKSKIGME